MNYVLLYFSFIQIFSRLGIQCIVDIITTNERATIFYAIVDVFTSSIYHCSWWTQIQSIVCWLAVFHILTHAEFSIFESFRVHVYDPFSKTRKSFELKTVQEQRANIPYKISKDEQKRISSNKVTSILPLSFFLAVHGTTQYLNFLKIVLKAISLVE